MHSIPLYLKLEKIYLFLISRNNSRETKAQRNKRDVDHGVNEEQTSASTGVLAKASPSDNTHSYSKIRGRGRGRGQTQELKKSRKNAADFTREREEARKREAEEKQRQAQEDHFEGKDIICKVSFEAMVFNGLTHLD